MARASDRLFDEEARSAADLLVTERAPSRALTEKGTRRLSARTTAPSSSRLNAPKDEGGTANVSERKLSRRDKRAIAKRHAKRLAAISASTFADAASAGESTEHDTTEVPLSRVAALAPGKKDEPEKISGWANEESTGTKARVSRLRTPASAKATGAKATNAKVTNTKTASTTAASATATRSAASAAPAKAASTQAATEEFARARAKAVRERARDVARKTATRLSTARRASRIHARTLDAARTAARTRRARSTVRALRPGAALAKASAAAGAALVLFMPLFIVGAIVVFAIGGAAGDDGSWNMEGLSANERAVAEYFKSCGLGKVQVAAIMGNIARETGKTFDPAIEQNPGGAGGIGLLQWGHLVDGGRGDQMSAWAASIGSAWSDMTVQLHWCWAEMTNEGPAQNQTSWYSAFSSPTEVAAFNEQTDIEAATRQFYRWMENPGTAGVPAMDERIAYAKEYLAIFRLGSGEGDAAAVIDVAYSKLGAPYVFGAAGPDEFDCSGFVKWCFEQCGVPVPGRTADQIYRVSMPISAEEARPGDIVVFTYGSPQLGELFGHIGIYLGDGMMIDTASPPQGVKVGPVGAGAAYGRLL